jgi:UDP-N-acetylmuramoyl-tripeptide--D-alanyl-D-alanine ligase
MISISRGRDWFEHYAKAKGKAVYERPIIELARIWRGALSHTCFVGVTGSAGKTTTKDLLHAALASTFRCNKSDDSHNQLYDIALTLFRSAPSTQFCVHEIGAFKPGRFEPMLALLKPRVGVLTNIGSDHISEFRTLEAVATEKAKLIAGLPPDGIAVLNADEPRVAAMASSCRARVVTFGLYSDAQFRAEILRDSWPDRLTLKIHHGNDAVLLPTRFLAAYQASNVLAAVATACSLGVPLKEAASAISIQEPLLARMSVHATKRGVTFIRDDLKAPEWSLTKAFQYMAKARAARKLIVIGTISDHGGKSHIYRSAVEAALAAADYVILAGGRASASAPRLRAIGGDRLRAFQTVQEAAHWLSGFARTGDLVLLKGSKSADHLGRIALAMDRDVRCWRSACSRRILCDRCGLIQSPAAP